MMSTGMLLILELILERFDSLPCLGNPNIDDSKKSKLSSSKSALEKNTIKNQLHIYIESTDTIPICIKLVQTRFKAAKS